MRDWPKDIYTEPEPDLDTLGNLGTWSYEQDTILIIPGQAEPFHHTDRNTLRKIGEPKLNPTAQAAMKSAKSPVR